MFWMAPLISYLLHPTKHYKVEQNPTISLKKKSVLKQKKYVLKQEALKAP